MTKTISLSDEAYDALASVKRSDESFSDVARRLARIAAQEALFDPSFRIDLSEDDAQAWKRAIYDARERTREPRVRFR